MAGTKSSNVHLPNELRKRDEKKYATLIENAANNVYHDFKSNETMPKVKLVSDLTAYPELSDIRQDVMDGVYDDPADETDKAMMRAELEADGASEAFIKALGL